MNECVVHDCDHFTRVCVSQQNLAYKPDRPKYSGPSMQENGARILLNIDISTF
jgi:hypothetical protein